MPLTLTSPIMSLLVVPEGIFFVLLRITVSADILWEILPMKPLLFLLCSLFSGFIRAQDCTNHLLMQKGTQLEYKFYWTLHNKPDSDVSRLLYQVNQVTDSAGSTWSSMTKKGFGVFDSTKHYERKVVLQCDGQVLLIPYDLYLPDTIYTRDLYPTPRYNDSYGFAMVYVPLEDAISYIIPLNLECVVRLPEGKKRFHQTIIPGYKEFTTFKSVPYYVNTINILHIYLAGKENVTTPAGTFPCYKICVVEGEAEDDYEPLKAWLYFNKEVWLVKLEHYRTRVELNSIRK